MLSKIFCLLFALLLNNEPPLVSCANILGLMAVPSPSHHIWNSAPMHRLAELGHNVTILSVDLPTPFQKVPPNAHYIHLEKGYSMYENEFEMDITTYIGVKPFTLIHMFYDFGWKSSVGISQSQGLQTLLNYPDDFKFDLIFYDYAMGPILLGFLHKFHYPPVIGLCAFLNAPITIDIMANHYFPAYIPYHSANHTAEMDFWQRMKNTLLFVTDTLYRRVLYLPRIDGVMRPYFPKGTPSLAELQKHVNLAMVNAHPAVTFVEPIPPNVIEVGGMQVLDPSPLPKEFGEFVNKSKNGVILVSFGTNMKSSDFKEDQVKVILDALVQLPQYDFIWKFDAKYLKEKLPRNILAKPFIPQSDLLAHPKIKAFVTHCGALSTHEAIWRGVPMIGVPLYFDQFRNILQSIAAGVAVKLEFQTLTTADLRDTIKKVVEDQQMAERSKYLSSIFRDRPMKPVDTVVWWAEYLLRHPKPTHLKSPASKLNIFQANSLDVLLALWTLFLLLTWLTVKLLSLTWTKFTGPKKPPSASKLKMK